MRGGNLVPEDHRRRARWARCWPHLVERAAAAVAAAAAARDLLCARAGSGRRSCHADRGQQGHGPWRAVGAVVTLQTGRKHSEAAEALQPARQGEVMCVYLR